MKKIFIIDDEQSIVDSLQFILEAEGYQIQSAKNGKEALDILNSGFFIPDLILLDLMMPVMDGFECAEELTHHPPYSFIPIVLMSAQNVQYEGSSLRKFPYLGKPFELDELFRTIEGILEKKGL